MRRLCSPRMWRSCLQLCAVLLGLLLFRGFPQLQCCCLFVWCFLAGIQSLVCVCLLQQDLLQPRLSGTAPVTCSLQARPCDTGEWLGDATTGTGCTLLGLLGKAARCTSSRRWRRINPLYTPASQLLSCSRCCCADGSLPPLEGAGPAAASQQQAGTVWRACCSEQQSGRQLQHVAASHEAAAGARAAAAIHKVHPLPHIQQLRPGACRHRSCQQQQQQLQRGRQCHAKGRCSPRPGRRL